MELACTGADLILVLLQLLLVARGLRQVDLGMLSQLKTAHRLGCRQLLLGVGRKVFEIWNQVPCVQGDLAFVLLRDLQVLAEVVWVRDDLPALPRLLSGLACRRLVRRVGTAIGDDDLRHLHAQLVVATSVGLG